MELSSEQPWVLLTAVLPWLSSGNSFSLLQITKWPAKLAPVNASTGAKLSRLLDTRNAVKNVQWIKVYLHVFGDVVFLCYDFIKQLFCKVFFFVSWYTSLNFNAANSDFHLKATIKHQMLLVLHRLYVLQTLYFLYKLNKDIFYVGV